MREFLINLEIKYKIAIVVGILIIIIASFIFIYRYYYGDEKEETNTNEENIISNEIEDNNHVSQNNKISLFSEDKKIIVHVIGEINTPGVVKLPEGARIIDAIELAGGTTENADISKINLAYIVEDGVQIYVPRIGENNEDTIYIKEGAGDGIVVESSSQEKEEEKDIKVNINSANSEKLQTIPGIGSVTAQKIIEYREQNGKFKNTEDIKNVSGIGEAKFEKLKNYITVK